MPTRSRPAIIIAAVLAACGPADEPGRTEFGGDQLETLAAPTRIVSLSPSLTELLFAIGAGDRVVGRTRWCTEPAEALAVPSVGDGLEPNLEAIVARRPDLVVFYRSPSNAPAVERLHALEIPTLSISMDRLEDVAVAARTLARVIRAVPAAENLADAYEEELARMTAAQRARAAGPSVLMLTWDSPPIVIGGGSYLSEMVALAGGRNLFADLGAPSATVSIEVIAVRDPDLVLFVGDAEPTIAERPEWKVVPAVRDGRFIHVTGSQFSWPSFRSLAGITQIARAIAGGTP